MSEERVPHVLPFSYLIYKEDDGSLVALLGEPANEDAATNNNNNNNNNSKGSARYVSLMTIDGIECEDIIAYASEHNKNIITASADNNDNSSSPTNKEAIAALERDGMGWDRNFCLYFPDYFVGCCRELGKSVEETFLADAAACTHAEQRSRLQQLAALTRREAADICAECRQPAHPGSSETRGLHVARVEYVDMDTNEVLEGCFVATAANYNEAVKAEAARQAHADASGAAAAAAGGGGTRGHRTAAAAAAGSDDDDEYEDVEDEGDEEEEEEEEGAALTAAESRKMHFIEMFTTHLETLLSVGHDLGLSGEDFKTIYESVAAVSSSSSSSNNNNKNGDDDAETHAAVMAAAEGGLPRTPEECEAAAHALTALKERHNTQGQKQEAAAAPSDQTMHKYLHSVRQRNVPGQAGPQCQQQ